MQMQGEVTPALLNGLERLKGNHAKLKARKNKLEEAVDLCKAQIRDYIRRLGPQNISISPSDPEMQANRMHRKISRLIKQKNRDYELTVDLQSLIEQTVQNLCAERVRIKHLTTRKNSAIEDLRSVVSIVNAIKGNPTPEEAQALLRHKISQNNDTVASEKMKLLRQIRSLKKQSTDFEDKARIAQLGLASKNNAITRLEDTLAEQDEKEYACEDTIADIKSRLCLLKDESASLQSQRANLLANIQALDEKVRQVIRIRGCYAIRLRKLRKKKSDLCHALKNWRAPLAKQFLAARKHRVTTTNPTTTHDSEIERLKAEIADTKRATEKVTRDLAAAERAKTKEKEQFNAATKQLNARLAKMRQFIKSFSSDIV